MKEIGILFNADMVKAVLEGRKNQTRRIIHPQPDEDCRPCKVPGYMELEKHWGKWAIVMPDGETKLINCRYGAPGDLLYVKETYTELPAGEYQYKVSTANGEELGKWKPSLFMPKKAARIWLRNTGVRVEHLQDISEKDAIGEGIKYWNIDKDCLEGGEFVADYENYTWTPKKEKDPNYEDRFFPSFSNPIDSFRTLIQSIHGVAAWESDPWVFVINFEILSLTGKPDQGR